MVVVNITLLEYSFRVAGTNPIEYHKILVILIDIFIYFQHPTPPPPPPQLHFFKFLYNR